MRQVEQGLAELRVVLASSGDAAAAINLLTSLRTTSE
jgi:hypothetical protein